MPAVCNVKKGNFESKLGRLFIFVKVINLEFSFLNQTLTFIWIQGNECISTLAKKKDLLYHKQPFLVVSWTMEHTISFNLVIDETVIPLTSSCSRAFHVLFASFFVFRLHYPQYLDKYFLFFEQVVFQIFEIRTEISILQPRIRKRFRGY